MSEYRVKVREFARQVGTEASKGSVVIIPAQGRDHRQHPRVLSEMVKTFGPDWRKKYGDSKPNQQLVAETLKEWENKYDMKQVRESLQEEARYKRNSSLWHKEVGKLSDEEYAARNWQHGAELSVSHRVKPSGLILTDQVPEKSGWWRPGDNIDDSRIPSPESYRTRASLRRGLTTAYGKDLSDMGVLQNASGHLDSTIDFSRHLTN